MEKNIYQTIRSQEVIFLKEELERIKTQIKNYKYKDSKENFNGMLALWKLRKDIVEEINKMTPVQLLSWTNNKEEDQED